jgi:hypothetical protein
MDRPHWFVPILLVAACWAELESWAQTAHDPRPASAVTSVMNEFRQYPIVALGELHQIQQEHDFIISLVRDPGFSREVNDIVVEFGSARYQSVVDRYTAGEQVSLEQLRPAWRDAMNILVWDSPVYERFFAAVRDLNKSLPRERRLRVWLGDPAVDWAMIHDRSEWEKLGTERDQNAADIVEHEVLARNRKALLIFGVAHLMRKSYLFSRHPDPRGNLAEILERRHPHRVFLIWPHNGGWAIDDVEPRLSSWPVPSMALLKGTWLGALPAIPDPDGPRLADLTDAFLYLGPIQSLTVANPSVELYRDKNYLHELIRRDAIQGGMNRQELDRLRRRFLQ